MMLKMCLTKLSDIYGRIWEISAHMNIYFLTFTAIYIFTCSYAERIDVCVSIEKNKFCVGSQPRFLAHESIKGER